MSMAQASLTGKTRRHEAISPFDAEAVELDLVVEPAEVFQHAVLAHAYAVAGAIAASPLPGSTRKRSAVCSGLPK
ncbi:hypothetical protein ACP3P8_17745 [Pseudomonas aeruginosa]